MSVGLRGCRFGALAAALWIASISVAEHAAWAQVGPHARVAATETEPEDSESDNVPLPEPLVRSHAPDPLGERPRSMVAKPLPSVTFEVTLPARIDRVEIIGLSKTRSWVVHREIGSLEGRVVSPTEFQLGLERLWATPLFSRVAGRILRRGNQTVARYELEERFSISPLFEFSSGGHATWFHAGVSEHNFLGRYLEIEGLYENFDGEHGGRLWFRDPRSFGLRLGLRVDASHMIRPRPDYLVQRSMLRLEAQHLVLGDVLRYGGSISVYRDGFLPPIQRDLLVGETLPTEMFGTMFEPQLRIGRVTTVRMRRRGATLEIRPALLVHDRERHGEVAQMLLELLAFDRPGRGWHLGLRARAAVSGAAPEHLQLWVGGLDLVRGFVDNRFRTLAYALYNLEVKYTLFDSTWLAALPTVFHDLVVVRDPLGGRSVASSVGAGIAFVIPKLVDSELRLEFAVPLGEPFRVEPSIGSAPFF